MPANATTLGPLFSCHNLPQEQLNDDILTDSPSNLHKVAFPPAPLGERIVDGTINGAIAVGAAIVEAAASALSGENTPLLSRRQYRLSRPQVLAAIQKKISQDNPGLKRLLDEINEDIACLEAPAFQKLLDIDFTLFSVSGSVDTPTAEREELLSAPKMLKLDLDDAIHKMQENMNKDVIYNLAEINKGITAHREAKEVLAVLTQQAAERGTDVSVADVRVKSLDYKVSHLKLKSSVRWYSFLFNVRALFKSKVRAKLDEAPGAAIFKNMAFHRSITFAGPNEVSLNQRDVGLLDNPLANVTLAVKDQYGNYTKGVYGEAQPETLPRNPLKLIHLEGNCLEAYLNRVLKHLERLKALKAKIESQYAEKHWYKLRRTFLTEPEYVYIKEEFDRHIKHRTLELYDIIYEAKRRLEVATQGFMYRPYVLDMLPNEVEPSEENPHPVPVKLKKDTFYVMQEEGAEVSFKYTVVDPEDPEGKRRIEGVVTRRELSDRVRVLFNLEMEKHRRDVAAGRAGVEPIMQTVPAVLTFDVVREFLPIILKITAERGHTALSGNVLQICSDTAYSAHADITTASSSARPKWQGYEVKPLHSVDRLVAAESLGDKHLIDIRRDVDSAQYLRIFNAVSAFQRDGESKYLFTEQSVKQLKIRKKLGYKPEVASEFSDTNFVSAGFDDLDPDFKALAKLSPAINTFLRSYEWNFIKEFRNHGAALYSSSEQRKVLLERLGYYDLLTEDKLNPQFKLEIMYREAKQKLIKALDKSGVRWKLFWKAPSGAFDKFARTYCDFFDTEPAAISMTTRYDNGPIEQEPAGIFKNIRLLKIEAMKVVYTKVDADLKTFWDTTQTVDDEIVLTRKFLPIIARLSDAYRLINVAGQTEHPPVNIYGQLIEVLKACSEADAAQTIRKINKRLQIIAKLFADPLNKDKFGGEGSRLASEIERLTAAMQTLIDLCMSDGDFKAYDAKPNQLTTRFAELEAKIAELFVAIPEQNGKLEEARKLLSTVARKFLSESVRQETGISDRKSSLSKAEREEQDTRLLNALDVADLNFGRTNFLFYYDSIAKEGSVAQSMRDQFGSLESSNQGPTRASEFFGHYGTMLRKELEGTPGVDVQITRSFPFTLMATVGREKQVTKAIALDEDLVYQSANTIRLYAQITIGDDKVKYQGLLHGRTENILVNGTATPVVNPGYNATFDEYAQRLVAFYNDRGFAHIAQYKNVQGLPLFHHRVIRSFASRQNQEQYALTSFKYLLETRHIQGVENYDRLKYRNGSLFYYDEMYQYLKELGERDIEDLTQRLITQTPALQNGSEQDIQDALTNHVENNPEALSSAGHFQLKIDNILEEVFNASNVRVFNFTRTNQASSSLDEQLIRLVYRYANLDKQKLLHRCVMRDFYQANAGSDIGLQRTKKTWIDAYNRILEQEVTDRSKKRLADDYQRSTEDIDSAKTRIERIRRAGYDELDKLLTADLTAIGDDIAAENNDAALGKRLDDFNKTNFDLFEKFAAPVERDKNMVLRHHCAFNFVNDAILVLQKREPRSFTREVADVGQNPDGSTNQVQVAAKMLGMRDHVSQQKRCFELAYVYGPERAPAVDVFTLFIDLLARDLRSGRFFPMSLKDLYIHTFHKTASENFAKGQVRYANAYKSLLAFDDLSNKFEAKFTIQVDFFENIKTGIFSETDSISPQILESIEGALPTALAAINDRETIRIHDLVAMLSWLFYSSISVVLGDFQSNRLARLLEIAEKFKMVAAQYIHNVNTKRNQPLTALALQPISEILSELYDGIHLLKGSSIFFEAVCAVDPASVFAEASQIFNKDFFNSLTREFADTLITYIASIESNGDEISAFDRIVNGLKTILKALENVVPLAFGHIKAMEVFIYYLEYNRYRPKQRRTISQENSVCLQQFSAFHKAHGQLLGALFSGNSVEEAVKAQKERGEHFEELSSNEETVLEMRKTILYPAICQLVVTRQDFHDLSHGTARANEESISNLYKELQLKLIGESASRLRDLHRLVEIGNPNNVELSIKHFIETREFIKALNAFNDVDSYTYYPAVVKNKIKQAVIESFIKYLTRLSQQELNDQAIVVTLIMETDSTDFKRLIKAIEGACVDLQQRQVLDFYLKALSLRFLVMIEMMAQQFFVSLSKQENQIETVNLALTRISYLVSFVRNINASETVLLRLNALSERFTYRLAMVACFSTDGISFSGFDSEAPVKVRVINTANLPNADVAVEFFGETCKQLLAKQFSPADFTRVGRELLMTVSFSHRWKYSFMLFLQRALTLFVTNAKAELYKGYLVKLSNFVIIGADRRTSRVAESLEECQQLYQARFGEDVDSLAAIADEAGQKLLQTWFALQKAFCSLVLSSDESLATTLKNVSELIAVQRNPEGHIIRADLFVEADMSDDFMVLVKDAGILHYQAISEKIGKVDHPSELDKTVVEFEMAVKKGCLQLANQKLALMMQQPQSDIVATFAKLKLSILSVVGSLGDLFSNQILSSANLAEVAYERDGCNLLSQLMTLSLAEAATQEPTVVVASDIEVIAKSFRLDKVREKLALRHGLLNIDPSVALHEQDGTTTFTARGYELAQLLRINLSESVTITQITQQRDARIKSTDLTANDQAFLAAERFNIESAYNPEFLGMLEQRKREYAEQVFPAMPGYRLKLLCMITQLQQKNIDGLQATLADENGLFASIIDFFAKTQETDENYSDQIATIIRYFEQGDYGSIINLLNSYVVRVEKYCLSMMLLDMQELLDRVVTHLNRKVGDYHDEQEEDASLGDDFTDTASSFGLNSSQESFMVKPLEDLRACQDLVMRHPQLYSMVKEMFAALELSRPIEGREKAFLTIVMQIRSNLYPVAINLPDDVCKIKTHSYLSAVFDPARINRKNIIDMIEKSVPYKAFKRSKLFPGRSAVVFDYKDAEVKLLRSVVACFANGSHDEDLKYYLLTKVDITAAFMRYLIMTYFRELVVVSVTSEHDARHEQLVHVLQFNTNDIEQAEVCFNLAKEVSAYGIGVHVTLEQDFLHAIKGQILILEGIITNPAVELSACGQALTILEELFALIRRVIVKASNDETDALLKKLTRDEGVNRFIKEYHRVYYKVRTSLAAKSLGMSLAAYANTAEKAYSTVGYPSRLVTFLDAMKVAAPVSFLQRQLIRLYRNICALDEVSSLSGDDTRSLTLSTFQALPAKREQINKAKYLPMIHLLNEGGYKNALECFKILLSEEAIECLRELPVSNWRDQGPAPKRGNLWQCEGDDLENLDIDHVIFVLASHYSYDFSVLITLVQASLKHIMPTLLEEPASGRVALKMQELGWLNAIVEITRKMAFAAIKMDIAKADQIEELTSEMLQYNSVQNTRLISAIISRQNFCEIAKKDIQTIEIDIEGELHRNVSNDVKLQTCRDVFQRLDRVAVELATEVTRITTRTAISSSSKLATVRNLLENLRTGLLAKSTVQSEEVRAILVTMQGIITKVNDTLTDTTDSEEKFFELNLYGDKLTTIQNNNRIVTKFSLDDSNDTALMRTFFAMLQNKDFKVELLFLPTKGAEQLRELVLTALADRFEVMYSYVVGLNKTDRTFIKSVVVLRSLIKELRKHPLTKERMEKVYVPLLAGVKDTCRLENTKRILPVLPPSPKVIDREVFRKLADESLVLLEQGYQEVENDLGRQSFITILTNESVDQVGTYHAQILSMYDLLRLIYQRFLGLQLDYFANHSELTYGVRKSNSYQVAFCADHQKSEGSIYAVLTDSHHRGNDADWQAYLEDPRGPEVNADELYFQVLVDSKYPDKGSKNKLLEIKPGSRDETIFNLLSNNGENITSDHFKKATWALFRVGSRFREYLEQIKFDLDQYGKNQQEGRALYYIVRFAKEFAAAIAHFPFNREVDRKHQAHGIFDLAELLNARLKKLMGTLNEQLSCQQALFDAEVSDKARRLSGSSQSQQVTVRRPSRYAGKTKQQLEDALKSVRDRQNFLTRRLTALDSESVTFELKRKTTEIIEKVNASFDQLNLVDIPLHTLTEYDKWLESKSKGSSTQIQQEEASLRHSQLLSVDVEKTERVYQAVKSMVDSDRQLEDHRQVLLKASLNASARVKEDFFAIDDTQQAREAAAEFGDLTKFFDAIDNTYRILGCENPNYSSLLTQDSDNVDPSYQQYFTARNWLQDSVIRSALIRQFQGVSAGESGTDYKTIIANISAKFSNLITNIANISEIPMTKQATAIAFCMGQMDMVANADFVTNADGSIKYCGQYSLIADCSVDEILAEVNHVLGKLPVSTATYAHELEEKMYAVLRVELNKIRNSLISTRQFLQAMDKHIKSRLLQHRPEERVLRELGAYNKVQKDRQNLPLLPNEQCQYVLERSRDNNVSLVAPGYTDGLDYRVSLIEEIMRLIRAHNSAAASTITADQEYLQADRCLVTAIALLTQHYADCAEPVKRAILLKLSLLVSRNAVPNPITPEWFAGLATGYRDRVASLSTMMTNQVLVPLFTRAVFNPLFASTDTVTGDLLPLINKFEALYSEIVDRHLKLMLSDITAHELALALELVAAHCSWQGKDFADVYQSIKDPLLLDKIKGSLLATRRYLRELEAARQPAVIADAEKEILSRKVFKQLIIAYDITMKIEEHLVNEQEKRSGVSAQMTEGLSDDQKIECMLHHLDRQFDPRHTLDSSWEDRYVRERVRYLQLKEAFYTKQIAADVGEIAQLRTRHATMLAGFKARSEAFYRENPRYQVDKDAIIQRKLVSSKALVVENAQRVVPRKPKDENDGKALARYQSAVNADNAAEARHTAAMAAVEADCQRQLADLNQRYPQCQRIEAERVAYLNSAETLDLLRRINNSSISTTEAQRRAHVDFTLFDNSYKLVHQLLSESDNTIDLSPEQLDMIYDICVETIFARWSALEVDGVENQEAIFKERVKVLLSGFMQCLARLSNRAELGKPHFQRVFNELHRIHDVKRAVLIEKQVDTDDQVLWLANYASVLARENFVFSAGKLVTDNVLDNYTQHFIRDIAIAKQRLLEFKQLQFDQSLGQIHQKQMMLFLQEAYSGVIAASRNEEYRSLVEFKQQLDAQQDEKMQGMHQKLREVTEVDFDSQNQAYQQTVTDSCRPAAIKKAATRLTESRAFGFLSDMLSMLTAALRYPESQYQVDYFSACINYVNATKEEHEVRSEFQGAKRIAVEYLHRYSLTAAAVLLPEVGISPAFNTNLPTGVELDSYSDLAKNYPPIDVVAAEQALKSRQEARMPATSERRRPVLLSDDDRSVSGSSHTTGNGGVRAADVMSHQLSAMRGATTPAAAGKQRAAADAMSISNVLPVGRRSGIPSAVGTPAPRPAAAAVLSPAPSAAPSALGSPSRPGFFDRGNGSASPQAPGVQPSDNEVLRRPKNSRTAGAED